MKFILGEKNESSNQYELALSGLSLNNVDIALETLKNMFIGLPFIEETDKQNMEITYKLFQRFIKELDGDIWLKYVFYDKSSEQLIYSDEFRFKISN